MKPITYIVNIYWFYRKYFHNIIGFKHQVCHKWSKSTPILVKNHNFCDLYHVAHVGFTLKFGFFHHWTCFKKKIHTLKTKIQNFWGSLSTTNFFKVAFGVGILWNSPRQVWAKSRLLISYMKPITFLVNRCWFYHPIDIYIQNNICFESLLEKQDGGKGLKNPPIWMK